MPKLDKMDKIRIRNKIRKQYSWLAMLNDPHADILYRKLEERLQDVFRMYPFGFDERFKKLLTRKLAHYRSV